MDSRRFLQQNEIFGLLAVFFVVCTSVGMRRAHRAEQEVVRERARAEQAVQSQMRAEVESERLRHRVAELEEERKKLRKPLDKALITILSEDNPDFRFDPGSAKIPEGLKVYLRDVVIQDLEAKSSEFNCDVIEVVGHTDEKGLKARVTEENGGLITERVRRSNLDQELLGALNNMPHIALEAGSNVDLGIMRAASIVRFLRSQQLPPQNRLSEVRYFLPYSAGQTILRSGTIAPGSPRAVDQPERRRIEIHLRKSGDPRPTATDP